MAVKVSDVQEIGDPSGLLYGFTISDDRTPPNMITLTFKTRHDARRHRGRGQRGGTARKVNAGRPARIAHRPNTA